MSSSVSDENLERKFQGVTNTQDSIQTLSLWLLHHKAHHPKIVSSWMKVLKKAKISHRLTLFYLANDVIQNGKRKGFPHFGNSFAEVLREATLLVRDEQIRPSIQRVFNIWEQRNIYTPEFIADLRAILANTKVPATAHSVLLAEFKPEMVIEKLKGVMKLELDVVTKTSTVNLSKLNATNAEIVQQLKDRIHGQQFKREFDESAQRLEDLIKTINKELKERTELILLLEQSEIYYDTQRGEAKIVANAYKNFAGRVKNLQKKLEELTATFPSPVPSPSPDAPSPTTSDHELDLELPNEQNQPSESELENLENVPSPIGTPEGLNLNSSPPATPPQSTEAEVPPVTTQPVGNPIPTLSNFFSHEQSGMSSWLGTFSNKKKTLTSSTSTNDVVKRESSSLDSRLSNLLQNIPNLPSGLQSTIFGNSSSGNNTPLQDSANSPLRGKRESSHVGESITPVKDDYSGQNTPLQDEESTHSSQTFFPKVTSNNKPKDILKNLTSLIQSVSSDKSEDSQKKEKYGYGSNEYFGQEDGMSSFIKKIIPSASNSSPSSYFNSSQPALPPSVQTVPVVQTTTVDSYMSVPFQDIPVYSSKPASINSNEQLSFIPSLVPSLPQDTFSYAEDDYAANEYNPELETFDTSMDIDNPMLDDILDEHSPTDSLSPIPSASVDEIPRPIGGRRLSTLITVVTKDSPELSLPSPEHLSNDASISEKENNIEETEEKIQDIPPVSPKTNETWTEPNISAHQPEPAPEPELEEPEEPATSKSPTEEFFIGKETPKVPPFFTSNTPPPQMIEVAPSNGQNIPFVRAGNPPIRNPPLSKIETVYTPREGVNGKWHENWSENHRRPPLIPGPPPMPCGMQNTRFSEKRNFHPPHFPSRMPRHRFEKPFRPYWPHPPPNSNSPNKRFPFRGRGRGRFQHNY